MEKLKKIFHKGHENARNRYKTKSNADYWLEILDTSQLNTAMIEMISNLPYFFFATSSLEGQPHLNFKGGNKGILHVVNNKQLVFPDLAGNGILHSMGDLEINNKVSLLIADFNHNARLKIIGKATVIFEDVYIHEYTKFFNNYTFDRLIIIDIDYVLPNCPKNMYVLKDDIEKFDKNKKDLNIIQKLCGFI
ncbi:pyridoxamine 5'-phosphate oxidase family protein [Sulfurimonas sp.]